MGGRTELIDGASNAMANIRCKYFGDCEVTVSSGQDAALTVRSSLIVIFERVLPLPRFCLPEFPGGAEEAAAPLCGAGGKGAAANFRTNQGRIGCKEGARRKARQFTKHRGCGRNRPNRSGRRSRSIRVQSPAHCPKHPVGRAYRHGRHRQAPERTRRPDSPRWPMACVICRKPAGPREQLRGGMIRRA